MFFYGKEYHRTFFLWPTIAIGMHEGEPSFIEIGWMFYSIGLAFGKQE